MHKNRYVVTDIPGYNNTHTQKPLNTIMFLDKLKPWIRVINKEHNIEHSKYNDSEGRGKI